MHFRNPLRAMALVFVAMLCAGCSVDYDNDYTIEITAWPEYYTLERINNYHPQTRYEYFVAKGPAAIEELNNRTRYRGDLVAEVSKHIEDKKKILILLRGDPGAVKTAKRELAQLVNKANVRVLIQGTTSLIKSD